MLANRRWLSFGALLFLAAVCLVLLAPRRNIKSPHSLFRDGGERWPGFFPPMPEGCFATSDHKVLGDFDLCSGFPKERLSDIQVVIKSGVGERDHLAALLNTYASCIPNAIVVSDAPDRVAGREVIDVLADLPSSYAKNNSEWKFYTTQREAFMAGRPVQKSSEGWKLDKYKFLPMVDRAYRTSPNAKWYVFIETDIYYFWDTLFRVLDRLNPEEHHYLGSPTPGPPGIWFAYGGAGIIVSNGLMRDLMDNGRRRLSVKYEGLVREDCCGDAILAYAFDRELGARLGHIYPTTPGQEFFEMQFTDEKWCTPLMGLHRVSSESMAAMWAWERCRAYSDRPIQYSTFLDFGLTPILRNETSRDHWNNGADGGKEHKDVTNASSCAELCLKDKKCKQYLYKEQKCFTAEYIQVGRAVDEDVTSGWDLAKLERRGYFIHHKLAHTCADTKWIEPRVGKPFDK